MFFCSCCFVLFFCCKFLADQVKPSRQNHVQKSTCLLHGQEYKREVAFLTWWHHFGFTHFVVIWTDHDQQHNHVSTDTGINTKKLEEVTSFKYLGATLCKDGTCSAEVSIRIASAMARLSRLWQCNIISFARTVKLYKSVVTSVLLCSCETWTLFAWLWKKKDPGFHNQVPEEISRISYFLHKTNDWVQSKINFLVGPQETLLATVKRQKLAWFWHVTHCNSLPQTIFQVPLEGGQHCGQQRKCWMNNIKEWT